MAVIESTQGGEFEDTSTWVGGVVPTTGDTAVVKHSVYWDTGTPSRDCAVQVDSDGELFATSVTVQLTDNLVLNGGILWLYIGGVFDLSNPLTTTAASTIDWNYGEVSAGDIFGGINASHEITHENCSGAKLTCDVAGTLNLGGDAIWLDITISANTILGRDLSCDDLDGTTGTLALGSRRITIAGTFDGNNLSFTNTRCHVYGGTMQNVDASGTNAIYAHDCTDGDGNKNVKFLNLNWYPNENLTAKHKMLLLKSA